MRLRATDLDWQWGQGEEVTGTGEALLMTLTGLGAFASRLSGPGAATLAQRCQADAPAARRGHALTADRSSTRPPAPGLAPHGLAAARRERGPRDARSPPDRHHLLLRPAAYLAVESISDLISQARPGQSPAGIAVTSAALLVMPSLAVAEHRTGKALGSRTLIANAAESAFWAFTSAAALLALGLSAWLGWWWANPVPLENRIRPVTCGSSVRQAARVYSLIRPSRMGFRRICCLSTLITVVRAASGSSSGRRCAIPWCGRAVL